MNRISIFCLFLLTLLLGACHSRRLSRAQLQAELPVDSAWRIGTLENGLTYYIRHNEEPQKQVDFYLLLRVGSLQETESQRGFAHFLEHMALGSTQHFRKDGIEAFAQGMGLDMYKGVQATAGIDNTQFYLHGVPVGTEERLDSCLMLLHDWAGGLLLQDEEIEKERILVQEEWQRTQNPAMRAYAQNLREMYPESLYGERLPIGSIEVITRFAPQELRGFYKDWYRPDLESVIVIGDIDVDEVEQKIRRQFADLRVPAHAPELHPEQVPDTPEPIYVINKDKEKENSLLSVAFKQDVLPQEKRRTLYAVRERCLNDLIADMLDFRLFEFSLEEDCPYLSYYSGYGMYEISSTKEALEVGVEPKLGMESEALERLIQEIERIRQFGFTQSEWNRQVAQKQNSLETAQRKRLTHGDYYQQCRNYILLGKQMASPRVWEEAARKSIESLGLKEANRKFYQLTESFRRNFVVTASMADNGETHIPTREELQASVLRGSKAELLPYEDRFSNGSLVQKLPKRGKVVSEEKADFGYIRWVLSNGACVYFKETDFGTPEINLYALSYGGEAYIEDEDWHMKKVFNAVVNAIGLGRFKSVELSKALMGKQVGLGLGINPLMDCIQGNCAPQDLKTLLEMTYLCFQEPADDSQAYESLMTGLKEELRASQGKPEQDFEDSLNVYFNAGDRRAWRLDEADLQKISFRQFKEMYAKRFNTAADFDFVFTGNIDKAELRELVELYLASLPKVEHREVLDASRNSHKFMGEKTVRFSRVMETPNGYIDISWRKAVVVTPKDMVLADLLSDIITQRLYQRIREDKGLAYSLDFSCGVDYSYQESNMKFSCECKPEQVDAVLLAVNAIMESIARQGIKAEELNQSRELMLKEHEENLRSNTYWQLMMTEKIAFGIDEHTHYAEFLQMVTREDLHKFFKQIFWETPNKLTVIMEPKKTLSK